MSKERAKGTGYETEALPTLQQLWPDAVRSGSADYANGDYKNTGDVCVEAKNHAKITLAAFMEQTKTAAARTGRYPLLIVKRKGKAARQSYAVMELQSLMDWMEHERREAFHAGQKAGPPDAGL